MEARIQVRWYRKKTIQSFDEQITGLFLGEHFIQRSNTNDFDSKEDSNLSLDPLVAPFINRYTRLFS